ncbi:MAG: MBL fold metallo-hydrolase [Candidatus Thermoplasmatota archaeon]
MLQLRWHGHACFEITNNTTLVTDPHDGRSIGIPTPTVQGDIILVSHNHYDHNSIKTVEKTSSKVITDERRRTIDNIEIKGFRVYHDKENGAKRGHNIMYKFTVDDISFLHLGDLGHELDEKIIKDIGDVDILFIPVGGVFTIDGENAWRIINNIKPNIIVPMHYKIGGLSIPVQGIEQFLGRNPGVKVVKVGNEIDIEKEDMPKEQEIWVFTI